MRPLDWFVLVAAVLGIVVYGVIKGRGAKDIRGYLLSDQNMKWQTIALSIMATQASAITFLSTTGLAYVDGMRFVQFYFGLPIAMVILSITAVPIFHRLKVFTAYEFLEQRFDLKTRGFAALLFLAQRGLAAGLTVFAPALVLSVILGVDILYMNVGVGLLVIIYTTVGGTKAVGWTQSYQMLTIMIGMLAALLTVFFLLPSGVGVREATDLAGAMGRLNVIDLEFDPSSKYNLWSGLLGGTFLALSYFGTDQSQVQRYLTGRSVSHSRMGLLVNGLVKVPMQFFILFIGAMVFVFYQFEKTPIFFNPVEIQEIRESAEGQQFASLESAYDEAFQDKQRQLEQFLAAKESENPERIAEAKNALHQADAKMGAIRQDALDLMSQRDPKTDTNDTNYIFLTFVVQHLPTGLVGLLIAAILFASMSSTSSELNALASTTVVDIYKRVLRPSESDAHYVTASKIATVLWGIYAIAFAQNISRLAAAFVESVNILGSLVYGTVLGIFMVAFYLKRIGGTATFLGAVISEVTIVLCFFFTDIAYLWFNVIGCVLVIVVAAMLNPFFPPRPQKTTA